MSMRAGIVVTGTEVLTGRVSDRNGPWLADRLEELGVDLAQIAIVGDRREDLLAALRFMTAEGYELILTSGGLGPTADDLTIEVVAEFQDRPMTWDGPLQERIEAKVARFGARWRNVDVEAMREGARKQATIPRGATVLEPVGTAPGLVVAPEKRPAEPAAGAAAAPDGPTVVVLPGPPRELQPMWETSVREQLRPGGALRAALAHTTEYRRRTLRLWGIPESEIAETLRAAERAGLALGGLEITTCLKRGEVEVVTRYEPPAQGEYDALVAFVRERHAESLFSEDGATIDEQVAALLCGDGDTPARTIATAESCTGGLLAARLTELPGASAYVRGALVAYANDLKTALAGVPAELIARHGAVSPEVAQALAQGARERLGADIGVGVTGVAGPGGGTEEKPVGTVCLSVVAGGADDDGVGGSPLTRTVTLPGGRADVRDRATTVALHLVRRALVKF
ncbi:MAG TPA: competence/damage-inducible protein A [Solirubrobacteraceae bacterium]|jgi:nicotinamide-nucleotide amidase|nr:competence/damage-inducible protein A [Solirubrobacteraceae bacterium]